MNGWLLEGWCGTGTDKQPVKGVEGWIAGANPLVLLILDGVRGPIQENLQRSLRTHHQPCLVLRMTLLKAFRGLFCTMQRLLVADNR